MTLPPIELIEKGHIDALIAEQVAERREIEYKAELHGNGREPTLEFLADVASFANAAGGHILYGVTDDRDQNGAPTGIPQEATGLAVNGDQEILRLENQVRDGIAPRILGVQVAAVDGFRDGSVIVIRVPRSFSSPHIVKFGGRSHFYSRNSRGKFQMDIDEIRAAFAQSRDLSEFPSRFRDEPLARIIAGETPQPVTPGAMLVLHLIPRSLGPAMSVSLGPTDNLHARLPPIGGGAHSYGRYNFDGFLTWDSYDDRTAVSYTQIFRSGVIEATTALPFDGEGNKVWASRVEGLAVRATRQYSFVLRTLGMDPPHSALLSLVGVRGYRLIRNSRVDSYRAALMDHDLLRLPECSFEAASNDDQTAATALRAAFDTLAQAGGYASSRSFNATGEWSIDGPLGWLDER